MSFPESFTAQLRAAKTASRALSIATTAQKNAALNEIANTLKRHSAEIVAANAADLRRGAAAGMAAGLLDRLKLDDQRVAALAAAISEVVRLPDPIGEVLRGTTLANGIKIAEQRVPFGVVGVIYEARPNVTVDIAALALKSGNGAVLRGGSAASDTNRVLVRLIQQAISAAGLDGDAIQNIDDYGRDGAQWLMRARGYIDVLIPRGSADLIATVVRESTVPVIETGSGLVHVFVDASADTQQAVEIVLNAKTQRPSVCNAAETLLVHRRAQPGALQALLTALAAAGVQLHGDSQVMAAAAQLPELRDCVQPANDTTWGTEHLALAMNVKVVDSFAAALAHIAEYSSQHTEAIVTADYARAERFLAEVDAAVVMVNASTRFTDGGEFGFGAEVGISTQKMHARGPMGLPELTSTKWVVRGSGQIR